MDQEGEGMNQDISGKVWINTKLHKTVITTIKCCSFHAVCNL